MLFKFINYAINKEQTFSVIVLVLRISCVWRTLLLFLLLAYLFKQLLIYAELFNIHSLTSLLRAGRKIYEAGVISRVLSYIISAHLHE